MLAIVLLLVVHLCLFKPISDLAQELVAIGQVVMDYRYPHRGRRVWVN
jgi:hypothetical protein